MFRTDTLPSSSGLKNVLRGTDSVSLVSAILRATMLSYRHLRGNEFGNCPIHTSIVKKEAEGGSETSVSVYWTIWCHNPKTANHFNPEGGSIYLRNVDIRILDYMVSQSRSSK
jgi:hypothetical protein